MAKKRKETRRIRKSARFEELKREVNKLRVQLEKVNYYELSEKWETFLNHVDELSRNKEQFYRTQDESTNFLEPDWDEKCCIMDLDIHRKMQELQGYEGTKLYKKSKELLLNFNELIDEYWRTNDLYMIIP